MDVILHVGAHRCASTAFQRYLSRNEDKLERIGVCVWGPQRTRSGLFDGLAPRHATVAPAGAYRRAVGRVRLNLAQAAAHCSTLVVSDENMLGSIRQNLRERTLYTAAAERLARYRDAFDEHLRDVVISIRSPDSYWASALGYSVARGGAVPGPRVIDRLAASGRQWRDVVTDLARALPGTRLWVSPYETFGGRPDTQLSSLAGVGAPKAHARDRVNASPTLARLKQRIDPARATRLPDGSGRWQPFSPDQRAALREAYAEDIMWLMAGADGLAELMDDPDKKNRAGRTSPGKNKTRGSLYDDEEK